MPNYNFYELLGVAKDADFKAIKRAYLTKISEFHPDKQIQSDEKTKQHAAEMSRQINLAFSVLSDETKRSRYDALYGEFLRKEITEDTLKRRVDRMIGEVDDEQRIRTVTGQAPTAQVTESEISLSNSKTKIRLKIEGGNVNVSVNFGQSSLLELDKQKIIEALHARLKAEGLIINRKDMNNVSFTASEGYVIDFGNIEKIIKATVENIITEIVRAHRSPPQGVFFNAPPIPNVGAATSFAEVSENNRVILNLIGQEFQDVNKRHAVIMHVREMLQRGRFIVTPIDWMRYGSDGKHEIEFKVSDSSPSSISKDQVNKWVAVAISTYDPEDIPSPQSRPHKPT